MQEASTVLHTLFIIWDAFKFFTNEFLFLIQFLCPIIEAIMFIIRWILFIYCKRLDLPLFFEMRMCRVCHPSSAALKFIVSILSFLLFIHSFLKLKKIVLSFCTLALWNFFSCFELCWLNSLIIPWTSFPTVFSEMVSMPCYYYCLIMSTLVLFGWFKKINTLQSSSHISGGPIFGSNYIKKLIDVYKLWCFVWRTCIILNDEMLKEIQMYKIMMKKVNVHLMIHGIIFKRCNP